MLPDFSLHTVRSAATHFLENYPGLSVAASSAFLGHAPPLDYKDPEARSPRKILQRNAANAAEDVGDEGVVRSRLRRLLESWRCVAAATLRSPYQKVLSD